MHCFKKKKHSTFTREEVMLNCKSERERKRERERERERERRRALRCKLVLWVHATVPARLSPAVWHPFSCLLWTPNSGLTLPCHLSRNSRASTGLPHTPSLLLSAVFWSGVTILVRRALLAYFPTARNTLRHLRDDTVATLRLRYMCDVTVVARRLGSRGRWSAVGVTSTATCN